MVQAVRHALGFDEEHPLQRVATRGLGIGRLIDPGVSVPVAAELLDDALDLVAGNVDRPLEVHVLDPVGDAGETRALVLRADAVPTPDRGQRRRVNLANEYLEAVVEHLLMDRGRFQGGFEDGHKRIIGRGSGVK